MCLLLLLRTSNNMCYRLFSTATRAGPKADLGVKRCGALGEDAQACAVDQLHVVLCVEAVLAGTCGSVAQHTCIERAPNGSDTEWSMQKV